MIDVSHIPLHRLAISKQLVVAADAAAPALGPDATGVGGKNLGVGVRQSPLANI